MKAKIPVRRGPVTWHFEGKSNRRPLSTLGSPSDEETFTINHQPKSMQVFR